MLSIVHEVPLKRNPHTVAFLNECGPLAPPWENLRPTLEQLPVDVIGKIGKTAVLYGLDDDTIAEGLRNAVEFQNQDKWRCGACYRWMNKMYTPVACLFEDEIRFVAVCRQCDKRYATPEKLQAAIAPYVTGEVQP
jgi:hypothetical protein